MVERGQQARLRVHIAAAAWPAMRRREAAVRRASPCALRRPRHGKWTMHRCRRRRTRGCAGGSRRRAMPRAACRHDRSPRPPSPRCELPRPRPARRRRSRSPRRSCRAGTPHSRHCCHDRALPLAARIAAPTWTPEYGACACALVFARRRDRVNPRWLVILERVMGIEPTLAAWEAAVLPLNYTRAPIARGALFGSLGAAAARSERRSIYSAVPARVHSAP